MDKSKRDPEQELQQRKRIEWVFTELPFKVLNIVSVIMLVILLIYIWLDMSIDLRNFTVGVAIVALCMLALSEIYARNNDRMKELEKIVEQEKSNRG